MPLTAFKARDFRCLENVAVDLAGDANLITGPNAAGKTSILEAIGYLGRGKSFRSADTRRLVRHGCKEFLLNGTADRQGKSIALGVRNSSSGLETSVDGVRGGGAAALAEALPLQVIDPDVHNLVAGAPDTRRRFLDWLGFHVEPTYLASWRRFRRALKQRNAALRAGASDSDLGAWDAEFAESGSIYAALQQDVFTVFADVAAERAVDLLDAPVGFALKSGWASDLGLLEALRDSRERDRQQGATQTGPHRADLRLDYDERQARKLVSRGQQKLLASAMVCAGVEVVQETAAQRLLLLIDDPAAELDANSLERLMGLACALSCQLVVTSLVPIDEMFAHRPRVFHVEQGELSAA